MYKILITGSIHEIGLDMLSKEKDIEIQYTPDLHLAEIFKLIWPFYCILSRTETSISKELIEKTTKLKVIARAGVSIGNFDANYATEKGILVINTPGKWTNSVAELTIGLLPSAVLTLESHWSKVFSVNFKRWVRFWWQPIKIVQEWLGF